MTVLITGAAGGVAAHLRTALATAYDLRLTDRIAGDGVIPGDLTDPAFARDVCAGADTIVHLAADADPNRPWERLRGPNATGAVNVLDAAVATGVRRVVLASSLHAVAGHTDAGRTEVTEDDGPHPCCAYGVTKVFTENMGRLYAEDHGLSVVCLRLGGVRDEPMARSWLPGWLSGPDLIRLVTGALSATVHFGVYHGVSANTGSPWRYDRARADLGYQPRDDSAVFAGTVPDDLPAHPSPGVRIAHLT